MRRNPLLILSLLAVAGSASAYDPIVLARGWPQVAADGHGDCRAEARTNGQVVYLFASGLGADAPGHYAVTNGDMMPIERDIQADGNGEWARYYIPFRPSERGARVNVTITAGQCTLGLAFDWQRGLTSIGVDDTEQFEPAEAADVPAGY